MTQHAGSHGKSGSDRITPASIGAASDGHTHVIPTIPSVANAGEVADCSTVAEADGTSTRYARADHVHKYTDSTGGVSDGDKGDITVASGGTAWTIDSGVITDTHVAAANKDGTAATASMRTIGTGALQACAGNDSRLSDARTPTSHTHNLAVCFTIASASTLYSPADGATMFLGAGNLATVTTTWTTCRPFILPTAMSLTDAYVYWNGTTAAGSNENISAYVRTNDSTDYLIQTVGNSNAVKTFSNGALGGGVVGAGTLFAIKIVCPTWATNPTGVWVTATIQFTDVST